MSPLCVRVVIQRYDVPPPPAASTYALVATWLFAVGRVVARCVPSTLTAHAMEFNCPTMSFQAELDTWFPPETVGKDPHAAAANAAPATKSAIPAAKPAQRAIAPLNSDFIISVK